MLDKLASLLATTKGAAAATLIAGSAVAGGTVATVPEAREAVTENVSAVTGTLGTAVAAAARAANERRAADTSCGKPEVVAQRNEADKQLRDAFQDDHKALTLLKKGAKDSDHQKVNAVLKVAQDDLRSVLTVALTAVAKETQGRTGQVAKADGTGLAKPSPSPSASPRLKPSPSACAEAGGKPADVTLGAVLAAIVTKATADMDAIVLQATADTRAVPPAEHGKPSEPRGPESKGQPVERSGGKPSTPPGRAR